MARKHFRKDKNLNIDEVYRAEILNYDMVYYDVSDGPENDPATQIERRVCLYRKGEAPKDLQEHWRSAVTDTNRYYHSYFEGMHDALLDEPIEVTKEHDAVAQKLREEEERLLEPKTKYQYTTRKYEVVGESDYRLFFEAVDRYAEDESDEEAWATITRWRNRQLREEERV